MIDMESGEKLLRLMYRAFVDIRLAAADGDARRAGSISNLVHNIPLAMIRGHADDVLARLTERANSLGMASWLKVAIDDVEASQGE